MSDQFGARRRQRFLTESYFRTLQKHYASSPQYWATHQHEGDSAAQSESLACASVAEDLYRHLSLRYTAGEPIESLRAELTDVLSAYERYQQALAAFEQIPQAAPLGMGNLAGYERCMQLIGLCYLLHRRDLLPRIAKLQDPGYAGADALYEDLLCYALADRYETHELLHLEVYDPLLGAMYNATDEGSAADVKEYVDRWYPHFKYAPWHNGHLRMSDTDGDYFGYWAFEAGAVALLCDIDDSAIDHMVYPKDLVAWARANKALSEPDGEGHVRLRCVGGQPCPQAGFWRTPAQENSRRRFEAGDIMPVIELSSWGATIWQWDDGQGQPASGPRIP